MWVLWDQWKEGVNGKASGITTSIEKRSREFDWLL